MKITTINIVVEFLECAESQLLHNVDKTPPHQKLDKNQIRIISEHLSTLEKHLKDFKFNHQVELLQKIRKKVEDPSNQFPVYSYDEFKKDAYSLNNSIEVDLESITFGFIPADKSDFFENDKLFGEEVYSSFPSAREEIKEAGKCYAMGLNTACVFHLMRTVEVGARLMVKALKAEKYITTTKNVRGIKTKVKKPIELCNWKELRDGLNTALNALEAGKSWNTKKQLIHTFFSEAVATFSNFKDAWRNIISHGNEVAENRKLYLDSETNDIMKNTRHFMQHLAKKVKE